MVHGWNVIQPAVDLGFGCASGSPVDGTAAVSASFAATAVPSLVRAFGTRGIAGTVGARYPARGRQNLVQLFTPRYRDDPRPLLRRLAALGSRADAVQLELGVPLRWPGGWRRRFVEACTEALPALLAPQAQSTPEPPAASQPATQAWRQTLEIAGAGTSGLVALDGTGARLLLLPAEGGLVLFTGERTGGEAPGCVGGLRIERAGHCALRVHFTGPMVRFPDTTPFLDLERGLGGADVVESAEVALDFVPAHGEATGPADFGTVRGAAVLDGNRLSLDGLGFASAGTAPMVWPRVRAALDLGDGSRLSVTVGLADGSASGFLCRDGRHRPVAAAGARLGHGPDTLSEVHLDVLLDDGERVQLCPRPVHHLPVVRGHGATPLRLAYVCCRLAGGPGLAGWCEI